MITCNYEQEPDTLICTFRGRMDSAASQQVVDAFQSAWKTAQETRAARPGATRVVFDLAAVDFLTSAFLRLCLQGAKLAGVGNFRVVNTSPAVKKLFVVAGLEELVG